MKSLEERVSRVEESSLSEDFQKEIVDIKKEIKEITEDRGAGDFQQHSPVFQWATYRVVELSGFVAGLSAIVAALLLATGNVDVLKNPIFSLAMGIALLSVAVVSWRGKKSNDDLDVIYIP